MEASLSFAAEFMLLAELANMNPRIEPSEKMGLEGVRPSRNHPALCRFLLELSLI
jgi:hypothetical protein